MKHEEHTCKSPPCFTHFLSKPVWLFQVTQIMNVVWVFCLQECFIVYFANHVHSDHEGHCMSEVQL